MRPMLLFVAITMWLTLNAGLAGAACVLAAKARPEATGRGDVSPTATSAR